MYESHNLTDVQQMNLERLRAYLDRNWEYIPTTRERGYHDIDNLGSIESSHRTLTYRMKKQGKIWSSEGAKAMISLIEARVNHELGSSLEDILKELTSLPVASTFNLKVD